MSFTINGQKYRIGLRLAVVATVTKDNPRSARDRIMSTDIAVCNPADEFNPEKGARLAVTRALQRAFSAPCERAQIWDQIRYKVNEKANEVFDDAVDDVRYANN